MKKEAKTVKEINDIFMVYTVCTLAYDVLKNNNNN